MVTEDGIRTSVWRSTDRQSKKKKPAVTGEYAKWLLTEEGQAFLARKEAKEREILEALKETEGE